MRSLVALAMAPLRAARWLRLRGRNRLPRASVPAPAVPRWPLTWSWADGAPGWRDGTYPAHHGADRFAFARDVIVDQSGRVLRL